MRPGVHGTVSRVRLPELSAGPQKRNRWWQKLLSWSGHPDHGPPGELRSVGTAEVPTPSTLVKNHTTASAASTAASSLGKNRGTTSAGSTSTNSLSRRTGSRRQRSRGQISKTDLITDLKKMTAAEKAEVSASYPSMAQNYAVIVRGRLDQVVPLQATVAASLSKDYKEQLKRLKDEQAQWRRKHAEHVKRKREQEQRAYEDFIGQQSQALPSVFEEEDEEEEQLLEESNFIPGSVRLPQGSPASSERRPNSKREGLARRPAKTVRVLERGGTAPATMPEEPADLTSDAPPASAWKARDEDQPPRRVSALLASLNLEDLSDLAPKPASARTLCSPKSGSEFDVVVLTSKMLQIPTVEARKLYQDFLLLDVDQNGWIGLDEFKHAVRERCNIPESEDLPPHLVNWHFMNADKNEDGRIEFEDFVLWQISNTSCEEIMVPDRQERLLRQVARNNNLLLPEVEQLKKVFDGFDKDGSGWIDESEFRNMIIQLMNVKNPVDVSTKRLRRFWMEVDIDGNGTISFEEFLIWYCNVFSG